MNADCTALVVSCDAYADVVPPFIALWRRFWPDCPLETVLLTESESCLGFDHVAAVGPCDLWAPRILRAIGGIQTRFVFLVLNDYYLSAPVDTARFLRRLEQAKAADALNLRLNPKPPGRAAFGGEDSGLTSFPKNTAYAVSCQAGIWDRGFLASLLEKVDSAWQFERAGSYMFDASDPRPLLVTAEKEFPFVDAVHKGYWEREGVALLESCGIPFDFSRGYPPLRVRAKELLKKAVFNISPELVTRAQNRLAGLRPARTGRGPRQ